MPNLPQSVYDQFADPSVSVINMPQGTFDISKQLLLSRSNVGVKWKGCTLTSDPSKWTANNFYPVQIASVRQDHNFSTPPDPPRYMSRLSGIVTEATQQLVMDEPTDVQPGERVILYLGVDRFDPVEAMTSLPVTVQSVSGNVITFAQPIGYTIPDYGDDAGLRARVEPSLQWKIGPWGTWPSGANFSKGFGRNHGMERFVGGLVNNVTFDGGPTFKLVDVSGLSPSVLPAGQWATSIVNAEKVTINGLAVDNPYGSSLHVRHSYDVDVDQAIFTGQGCSKWSNTQKNDSACFTAWGGVRLGYSNIQVSGKDITLFNTEAGSQYIEVDGLAYSVDMTSVRQGNTAEVFNFNAVGSMPSIRNAKIKLANSSGGPPELFSFVPCQMKGWFELVSPFKRWFDFAYQRPHVWDTDSVTVNGVAYGPRQTRSKVFQVPTSASAVPIGPLHGLFLAARLRVRIAGGLRAVTDTFGNNYWNKTNQSGPGWKPFAMNHWGQIQFPGGQTVAQYETKAIDCWFAGAAPGSVEIEQTWLPRK